MEAMKVETVYLCGKCKKQHDKRKDADKCCVEIEASGNLKIEAIDHHRNGVSGESFYVVLFSFKEDGQHHNMVGILFHESGQCAVLDRDETAKGNIAFARGNSWRGDHFEGDLRAAINARNKERDDALMGTSTSEEVAQ